MLKLGDLVHVKKDYPHLSLTTKHIGAIVDILNNGEAYTVEFANENGDTIEEALFEYFNEDELSPTFVLDGSDKNRNRWLKAWCGLRSDQSFQDLVIEDDEEDEEDEG